MSLNNGFTRSARLYYPLIWSLIALLLGSCGGGSSGSNGGQLIEPFGNTPARALQGTWSGACQLTEAGESEKVGYLFNNGEISVQETLFVESTNCNSEMIITLTATGTYAVGSSPATDATVPLDIYLPNAQIRANQALIETLALSGTTFESFMLSRGIDNINNVPLSVNNIYTVFNIDGNTLRLGVYTGAAGSSPSDRILTFNQLLERTGSPIDTTIADETTPKPIDVANPDSSTNPLPASPAIPGLANVWYTGDSGVFGVEWRTYMTFSDRRTSRDFPTIISQGRAVSEQTNPDLWFSYDEQGGSLNVIYDNGNRYNPFFSIKTNPAQTDQRYSGCWESNTSFAPPTFVLETAIFSSKTFCFSSNGVYTTDTNTAFSSINVYEAGGSGGSSDAGYYRIDGHVITLVTEAGETSQNIIGWYQEKSGDRPKLVIGNNAYEQI